MTADAAATEVRAWHPAGMEPVKSRLFNRQKTGSTSISALQRSRNSCSWPSLNSAVFRGYRTGMIQNIRQCYSGSDRSNRQHLPVSIQRSFRDSSLLGQLYKRNLLLTYTFILLHNSHQQLIWPFFCSVQVLFPLLRGQKLRQMNCPLFGHAATACSCCYSLYRYSGVLGDKHVNLFQG